ncbi:hypothetical protein SDRG_09197 [Saprolegnia diclina VS20]|uniref:D-aminoacyl-tRNA deacylase n=1 Tax=Saprolegnia diclina (strain VS20) TaxID=1156394 RepID=T0RLM6_SAPDV|nr:hypothetical protein SDRG_09197 [Saprolegnia diclina VS20]EQC33213.1 hypothetical protein SDRG_09197 [Saprolegnia diclina VS20]|eukprot:XP_008613336.1 hypothetical protein SDRG_09197 [Saprolegnia diclina VS20]
MTFRCVTQRCEAATLLIDNVDETVSIGKGLILYVSWAKGATADDLPKIVKSLLTIRLLSAPSGKPQSICEASTASDEPVHVLVVPQAALTSKVQRGKNLQYHGQLGKDEGAEALYLAFVQLLGDMAKDLVQGTTSEPRLPVIRAGTFGNRQTLEFRSEGPFTHMLEM